MRTDRFEGKRVEKRERWNKISDAPAIRPKIVEEARKAILLLTFITFQTSSVDSCRVK